MGNRAVITTKENFENNGIGIYLHWNGGRESVEAFLDFCKAKGFRKPENDNYGFAYLTTIIGNFFADGLSIGIDKINKLDCNNGDNGVYIIENWEVVDRKYFKGTERTAYSFEFFEAINGAQPIQMRLSEEEIKSILEGKNNG